MLKTKKNCIFCSFPLIFLLTLTKLKLWQPRQLYQPFWLKHKVLGLKNKVGLSFQSNTNSIMWFGKHTNRYKIQDLNGYQFYIMSKFSKFGTALLPSLPKHIFHCFHRKLKFFNICTEFGWLSIHMLAILWHCILPIFDLW